MKRIISFVLASVFLAVPAIADSPAETFDASKGPFISSAETEAEAATKLSGDDVEERLPMGENAIEVTRGTDAAPQGELSQGHMMLAREMGVDPYDYSTEELSYMYMDTYGS